jgi:dihydroflavonol-4-reductase
MPNFKKAFVTGCTGFVGLNLVEQLEKKGWEVTAFHRRNSSRKYLDRFRVTHAEGDVNDTGSLRRGMSERVDAVFHVAGSSNLWSRANREQTKINVEGTRNVVEAALARGAKKLVFTSSWVTYGDQRGRFDETAEKRGRVSWVNHYLTKFLAEEEVHAGIAKGLDATIMNPSLIVGPYDTVGWARFIKMVYMGALPGVPPEPCPLPMCARSRTRTSRPWSAAGAERTICSAAPTRRSSSSCRPSAA